MQAMWNFRGMGYTLYRNVDKEATEALAENEGKLVYNYSLGVGNSTDASGIDAEASLKTEPELFSRIQTIRQLTSISGANLL